MRAMTTTLLLMVLTGVLAVLVLAKSLMNFALLEPATVSLLGLSLLAVAAVARRFLSLRNSRSDPAKPGHSAP